MSIKASELSAIIRSQIQNYGKKIKKDEVGNIITIGDGIALISGLESVMLGELLEFPNKVLGIALNLEEDAVGAVLLGDSLNVKEGDQVKRTGKLVSVPVGDKLLGRVVDALGQTQDGHSQPKTSKIRQVFRVAPGVMTRKEVNQSLETGILAIDSMVPIGKGQRELIIGDRQTGKTAITIDAIISQKGKGVNCIYVAIGQKNSTVAQIVEKLKKTGAMEYTTIVIATASKSAPLQFLAPFAGITIAEEWMEQGKDVLIVYDDLSKHAVAYRTLALLLRRPPGREAYPGDIFYLHSQLLERAARVNEANGGGSITALPIIETQGGDISAYIPTNVISITDGQIFTISDLFNSGQRPAVDSGYSVSRVGSTAQIQAIKQVSGTLKLELAQYNEMAAFAQFGSDLDDSTRKILSHGKKVVEILKQKQFQPIDQIDQAIILLAVQERMINPIPTYEILRFRDELITFFNRNKKANNFKKILKQTKAFDENLKLNILYLLFNFVQNFVQSIPHYKFQEHDILPKIQKPILKISKKEVIKKTTISKKQVPNKIKKTIKSSYKK